MMTAPIALQLYTVRQALAQDFAGVMDRVGGMGYLGIEPTFHLLGAPLEEAARRFQALDLEVPCAHVPLPLGEDRNKVLDFMATLDSPCIVSGNGSESFASLDLTRQTCDLFNKAHAVAVENGLSFCIHNHWWEFQQVEGRYVYQEMLERLHPDILFEIDTYWVQAAGLDPARVVGEFGSRAPLLHIKDGPAVRGEPMVAVGDGALDFPAIVETSGGATQWMIVELDDCATDMLAAVEKSYNYLTREGLAHGRGA